MKFIKSFFTDSNNKPQPIYFWSTMFSLCIFTAIILKFSGISWISDSLVIGMMGFIVAILALYNKFKGDKNE